MDVHHHRQIHSIKRDSQPKILLKHTSSDSSDSSVSSSVILTMCPIAFGSSSILSNNDHQSLTNSSDSERRHSKSSSSTKSSLIRPHLLNIGSSDHDSISSYSPSPERKSSKDEQSSSENGTVSLKRSKSKNKVPHQGSTDSFKHSQTSIESKEISLESCLLNLVLRPKLLDDSVSRPSAVQPPPPPPKPRIDDVPICPRISPERFQQFQQRQIEYDHKAEKRLETIKCQSDKNVKQISRYWAYIKQICLDKYQSKGGASQFFDYLLNSTYIHREYDLYFEENDEIQAALQVLTTTLNIIHSQHSFSTLTRIFDEEEKAMRERYKCQLEDSLATYIDQLTLMREVIRCYQSNHKEQNNFDWIQTIQIEYPSFIEKTNEFFNEVLSISQMLVQMLRQTNKNLLIIHQKINQM